MADETPKIQYSTPPQEPSVVSDPILSSPPEEPMDPGVLVLSDPPRDPVDFIGIQKRFEPDLIIGDTLDEVPQPPALSIPGLPWEPQQIETIPSGPPWDPNQVSIIPEPPPGEPVDVPLVLTSPPAVPFDVPTIPEPAPGVPHDVQTPPEPGPWAPEDVPTGPSPAPWEPEDVQVVPAGASVEPFDVPIIVTRDHRIPPPGEQPVEESNRVRDHRDEPGNQPVPILSTPAPVDDKPDLNKTIRQMQFLDRELAKHLQDIADFPEPISIFGPGGASLDPTVLAKWLRDYISSVGKVGVSEFILQQTILYSKNPLVSRIFNPLYFLNMLRPGSMGTTTTTIDTQNGVTMEDIINTTLPPINVNDPKDYQNTHREDLPYSDGQDFDVGTMTDNAAAGQLEPTTPVKIGTGAGVEVQVFDSSKYFMNERNSASRALVKPEYRDNRKRSNIAAIRLAESVGLNGIIPAAIHGEKDGIVLSKTDSPSEPAGAADQFIDDDAAYMPFCFTDLRPTPEGKFRSVFFRPFNLNFSRSTSPEFEEEGAFGRTDPVVGYIKTTRTFEVSFDLHAFAAEDVETIHRKLIWLESMAYPTYSADALLKSGPICRMRIGDVVSSGRKGLPGVLKAISVDFADALWELRRGAKVPRSASVTLSFLALHEGPIGHLDGNFGVLSLPSIGESTPATVFSGYYQGFGEPRKK